MTSEVRPDPERLIQELLDEMDALGLQAPRVESIAQEVSFALQQLRTLRFGWADDALPVALGEQAQRVEGSLVAALHGIEALVSVATSCDRQRLEPLVRRYGIGPQ